MSKPSSGKRSRVTVCNLSEAALNVSDKAASLSVNLRSHIFSCKLLLRQAHDKLTALSDQIYFAYLLVAFIPVNHAITNRNYPMGMRRNLRLVCHQNNCVALFMQVFEQLHDFD